MISWMGEDMEPLASSLRAPVLLLTGEKDGRACCKIVSMRALEATVGAAISCLKARRRGNRHNSFDSGENDSNQPGGVDSFPPLKIERRVWRVFYFDIAANADLHEQQAPGCQLRAR